MTILYAAFSRTIVVLTAWNLDADPKSESRTSLIFIPPDERFPHTDFTDFGAHIINAFANLIAPTITDGTETSFETFEQIEQLYVQGFQCLYNSPRKLLEHNNPLKILHRILEAAEDNPLIDFVRPQVYAGQNYVLVFHWLFNSALCLSSSENFFSWNEFCFAIANESAWRADLEFARQALAGLNPMMIECLQVIQLVLISYN